jgi:hypothetical protein
MADYANANPPYGLRAVTIILAHSSAGLVGCHFEDKNDIQPYVGLLQRRAERPQRSIVRCGCNGRSKLMPNFRFMSAVALTIAVALAGATSVLSCLAAMSVTSAKCIGQELVHGYRSGALDFLVFPLFSLALVAIIMRARKNQSASELLVSHDVTVLEFGSLRITFGAFIVYTVLFGFVSVNAMMMISSAMRFVAVSSYCSSAAASG